MNSKAVKIALLIIQCLISAVVFVVLVMGISGGERMRNMVLQSIPCSIQTTANLIFSIILYKRFKETSMLDLQISHVLLLSTSLENVRIFAFYAQYSYREPISQDLVAPVFYFSLILTSVMFCGLSIIPLSKSFISVNNYVASGLAGSVLIMIFGPRITDMEHLNAINIYNTLVCILFAAALVSFLAGMLSNLRAYNVLKHLSIAGLAIGDFMIAFSSSLVTQYLGISLFVACEIILSIMIKRGTRSYAATDITSEAI